MHFNTYFFIQILSICVNKNSKKFFNLGILNLVLHFNAISVNFIQNKIILKFNTYINSNYTCFGGLSDYTPMSENF